MATPGTSTSRFFASHPPNSSVKLALLPLAVFACSLLVTFLLWKVAQHNAMQAMQTDFNYQIEEASDHIEKRMETYEQVLRGLNGLFAASENVSRDQFRNYVSRLRLQEHFPGIQGLGFALIVPPEQKSEHIAALRRQGFPGYTIHPGGERETYTSVIYIEPFNERNQRAFGYDMYSDRDHPRRGDSAPGLRRAAMEQARDTGAGVITGRAIITGKVRLMMEMESDDHAQAGFLMYFPVYRNGAPIDSLADRRANIIGWVYAPFRMEDLMAGILEEHEGEIDIEIFDGEEISDRTLLFDEDKIPLALSAKSNSWLHSSRRIEIARHVWTMQVFSLPALEAKLDTGKMRLTAYTGAAVSLLLMLLTWLGVHDRELAIRIARQASESKERINQLNEELTMAFKELESIMNAFPDLHYVIDTKGGLVRWNSSFEKFTGLARQELPERQLMDFICEEDRPKAMEGMKQILEKGCCSSEVRFVRHDGALIPFLCNGAVVKTETGEAAGILGASRDISERMATEERMKRLAHYDLLTGLPNRTLFSDRLQLALATAKRDKARMALMFIDLDDFKPINDDLGHDVGDLLLKQVAHRLQDCMRESDTAARIGGDEFLVLLPHIETEQDALVVSEKIRLALYRPFEVGGETLNVSSSIGIAIYPEHGVEERVLVKNADIAMYHAKKVGRNNVQLYRIGMQEIGA